MIDVVLYRFRIGVFTHTPKSKPDNGLDTPMANFECDDFDSNYTLNDLILFLDNDRSWSSILSYFILYTYIIIFGYVFSAFIIISSDLPGLYLQNQPCLCFSYKVPDLTVLHLKLLFVVLVTFRTNLFTSGNFNKSMQHFHNIRPNRFSSKLSRFLHYTCAWTYLINLALIVIANPSLLNPGPSELSVIYQNVQGLIPFSELGKTDPLLCTNKILELQCYYAINKPDIIVLNETWLKASIRDEEILDSNNYKLFRRDRSAKSHPLDPVHLNKFKKNGGGVAIAVRADLCCDAKLLKTPCGAEMIAVQLTLPNNEKVIIFTCYRVGTLGITNQKLVTDTLFSLLNKRNPPKLYIIGDFNLAGSSWHNNFSSDVVEQSFMESFSDLALKQCIVSPTHIGGKSLDILLTNFPNTVGKLTVCDKDSLCKSDHFPISFVIRKKVSHKKMPKRTIYNFNSANWIELNREINCADWSFIDYLEIDVAWHHFKSILFSLVDKHIQKVTIKNEFQPPWFDSESLAAYRKKEFLRAKHKRSGSNNDELKFNVARKDFNKVCSRKMRENLFQCDDDSGIITKKFWSFIKSKKKSSRIPQCVEYKGQLRNNSSDQAELFNGFFHEQFSSASDYDVPIDFSNDSLFDIDFNIGTIRKLLNNVNSNKAQGPDGIHGTLLKKCACSLAYPLSKLFSMSYNLGQIPREWKMANVVPVHKKGSKSLVENYRPISLTCLIMKVFERIIKDKILSLTSHLLDPRQHGFLANRSCTTNMVPFCDSIALALNNKLHSDVVYFDFSKAFDSVNHDIILRKLKERFNIDGVLLKFIRSYLIDRGQHVVIGNHSSSHKPVSSGVPQGSILGPLLFVLFINDLPEGLSEGTQLALYADDTKIWRTIKTTDDSYILQRDIDYLNDWASRNKMNFHPNKCKVLPITHSASSISSFVYVLGNIPLEKVDTEKDLGVDVNSRLNWNSQCIRLCAKANQQLAIIRRNVYFVNNVQRKRALYISLVRSQFEHCSVVWRPLNKTLLQKIENIQKRAIKWILSECELSYNAFSTYLSKCKQTKLFTMSDRFNINDLLFLHKVINGLIPVELPYYLSFFQGQNRLRSSHLDHLSLVSSVSPNIQINLNVVTSDSDRASSNPFNNTYFYRVHFKWNDLPLSLREISIHSDFKVGVSKYFWDNMKCDDNVFQPDSSYDENFPFDPI